MSRPAAVLIGGPPATGKTTLATALAPRLGAALLDLDVATGPLTRVVSDLIGVHDPDEPALARLTRAARYDTLLGLAEANLQAGLPVVLVAPFSAERAQRSAWAASTRRIAGEPTMVWLYLAPEELIQRLTRRALARDENKIRDPESFLTGLDLEPPAGPHLALDASQPTATLVKSVLDHLSRWPRPRRHRSRYVYAFGWSNPRKRRQIADDRRCIRPRPLHPPATSSDSLAIDGTVRQNKGMPSMAKSAPSRLLDVANAAGVSLRTASRVLNDDPRVAPVTRQRVREAMLDLRFEPDAMARSLRAGTDTAIGFVVESISDPFFAEVIDAVELEMSRHGRSVLVTSTRRDPGWERDVIGRMMQRRIAGLLLCPTGDDHAWLDPRLPIVLVDRPAPGLSADLVEIDDHRAAFDAVSHLIGHGHQRIAYIGDTPAIPTSAARLRGYRDALAHYEVTADEHLVNSACATSQAAAHAVSALVGGARPPTAILSATTRASLGVVPTLHSVRRTDIALVAFGDFPMADALRPAVTVVDHPGHEVGRVAAERLLARLEAPGLPVERIQVPARIIERGSGELRP